MKLKAAPAKAIPPRFVAYYRVSTQHQGLNGLGMDAQKSTVKTFLNGGDWELLGEFAEVESGKRKDRPKLNEAIALCRKTKAKLVIAKLDRLARNVAFLSTLQESGIEFVACDLPAANKFMVHIMAAVAEQEREWISERTKAGLAAAKLRKIKLGNPHPAEALKRARRAYQQQAKEYAASIVPVIQQIRKAGVTSLRGIAQCLTMRGFKTRNGKGFEAQSVKNLLAQVQ